MPNPDAALSTQAAASPPEYRRGVTEARMRFEVLAIFRGARCQSLRQQRRQWKRQQLDGGSGGDTLLGASGGLRCVEPHEIDIVTNRWGDFRHPK
jgi:hypothetical protein